VLVVDDEEGIRTVLQRLLARLPDPPPVVIETADSAERALELLEAGKYALILTDFNMGGKDGVFLLATARERWPETLRTLMTGYTDEQIMNDAQEKGKAAAVIRKPWNNQELVKTIQTLLKDDLAKAKLKAAVILP
jgi:CheY-like chemotaxis protein